MKKFLAALLACALLFSACAQGEERAALFPAYDDVSGKWGYIDVNGAWAIPPQYGWADVFRGRYAAASTGDPWAHTMGIIDETGAWVVEPRYFVDGGYDEWYYGGLNAGMYLIAEDGSGCYGFFDVPSGCFSGIQFDNEFRWWTSDSLVPIEDAYYDRTTGRLAFSLPEGYFIDWLGGDSVLRDGYGWIWKEQPLGEDGLLCLVGRDGTILELAELEFREHDWGCGLLRAKEKKASSGEAPILGYYDPAAGDWRITGYTDEDGRQRPFREAYPFSGGYACVRLQNGNYAHIDTRGNVVFGAGAVTWESETGVRERRITQPYTFYGGHAWIEEAGVLIDPAGKVAAVIPEGWTPMRQEDDEMDDSRDYYVSPGGVIAVQQKEKKGNGRWALLKTDGQWLLDPEVYSRSWSGPEPHRFFSEGLQAVDRIEGIQSWRTVHYAGKGAVQEPVYEQKVGYVNEQGETIVDFRYDGGGAFLNGLALVWRDGQTGYVNKRGEEVFFWGGD